MHNWLQVNMYEYRSSCFAAYPGNAWFIYHFLLKVHLLKIVGNTGMLNVKLSPRCQSSFWSTRSHAPFDLSSSVEILILVVFLPHQSRSMNNRHEDDPVFEFSRSVLAVIFASWFFAETAEVKKSARTQEISHRRQTTRPDVEEEPFMSS